MLVARRRAGFNYKYDLSIPISKMYDLATEVRERLGDKAQTIAYGHVGDCTSIKRSVFFGRVLTVSVSLNSNQRTCT